MIEIKKKSFNDSFLYNVQANKHNAALSDFIINAERILDKKSSQFIGITEDLKRVQRTNVLYALLMSDEVVLCYDKMKPSGLPRSFKVFMAKDIRMGKTAPKKIFIDVSGLIVIKDGYYICKNLLHLVSYLFQALVYHLYEFNTVKLFNNSAISINGAETFSAMFCYVLDYMRIIGYEQSKNKIAYLAALYYLNNMCSKELDKYTKTIAAKIAEINPASIPAYDMYFEEEDFTNIDTFVTMIANNFHLKGLNTEVFVGRWNFTYSPSALYACELFTCFGGVLCAAYSGSYIVNQKQIEKICAQSMIKFATEIIKLGKEEFENSSYMKESAISTEAKVLKESLLGRNKVPEDAKFTEEDFKSKSKIEAKTKNIIKYYKSTQQENKISGKLTTVVFTLLGLFGANLLNKDDYEYEYGSIAAVLKLGKNYFNERNVRSIKKDLSRTLNAIETKMKKYRDNDDKENAKKYSKASLEIKKSLTLL